MTPLKISCGEIALLLLLSANGIRSEKREGEE
jgi:hypothetical protein